MVLWRLAVEVLGGAGTIADGGAGVADPGAVADRSAWMVAIIPSAFVLAFAYSEGPSLLLVAATLLALHRRAFVWTALWALAAAAVRPVGVLLVVPIAVEVARTLLEGGPTPPGPTARGDGPARPGAGTVLGMGAAVVAPLAGLGLAMAWLGSLTGDAGLPLRIQRQLRDGFRDPVTRLAQAVWDVTRGDFRDVYNLAFALAFIALAVVAVRRRQPLAWILYSVATLVVAGSANNIDSVRALRPAGPSARHRTGPVGRAALAPGPGGGGRQRRPGVADRGGAPRPGRPLTRPPAQRRPAVVGASSAARKNSSSSNRPDVGQEDLAVALEVHELLGQQEHAPVEVGVVHAVGLGRGPDPALLLEPRCRSPAG